MDASLPCFTLGEVCPEVLCVRSEVQPHRGMACRSAPRTCMVLAVRVGMFLGVVARHAPAMSRNLVQDIVPSILVRPGHTKQNSTPTRSLLPELREQFQLGALPLASPRNTNLASTDFITTWILAPNQCASLAMHPLNIRSCLYK